ncbi:MAG TPA: phosphotransferase [Marmoricola sp.]|nr:phosphotransferase [Marmoricola sp.]
MSAPRKTAQRLQWAHLPPAIRDAVQRRIGSPVVAAVSQDSGFTPGMASVLTCADGSKHFVKAASTKAQRPIAMSYLEEARKLKALPDTAPAPALQWAIEGDWVILGINYVAATAPSRPWQLPELNACLDAIEAMSAALTPVPDTLSLTTFAEDFADLPGYWTQVRTQRPELGARAVDAARLAAQFVAVTAGDTVVHTDLRDDNTLLTADGDVLFCDWNWLVRGAPWLDLVFYLLQPRADGINVDAILAERSLTRDLPPEHIDIVLALLAGYFFKSARDPAPSSSPYLRQSQEFNGRTTWNWLTERRGWL